LCEGSTSIFYALDRQIVTLSAKGRCYNRANPVRLLLCVTEHE